MGFQIEFNFYHGSMVPYSIISEIFNIDNNDFVIDGNSLRISWIGEPQAIHINEGEILFSFPINEKFDGKVKLNNSFMNSEIYLSDYSARSVVLAEVESESTDKLIGNSPNPFEDETNIVFELGLDQEVTFEFYLLNGKQIGTKTQKFTKGNNVLKVDNKMINNRNSGIILFRMKTINGNFYGKMVKI